MIQFFGGIWSSPLPCRFSIEVKSGFHHVGRARLDDKNDREESHLPFASPKYAWMSWFSGLVMMMG